VQRWRCIFRQRGSGVCLPSCWLSLTVISKMSTSFRLTMLHILRRYSTNTPKRTPLPPKLSELTSKDAVEQARRWVDEFSSSTPSTSLRDTVELSFSRSSGPGGQVGYDFVTTLHLALATYHFNEGHISKEIHGYQFGRIRWKGARVIQKILHVVV